MLNAKQSLLEILRDTRKLLALPDNDFIWSHWKNEAEALAEFDGLVSHIEAGRNFDGSDLSILFAPTGAIQEVSISSGWGDDFLRVAARFDAAFAKYQAGGNP